MKLNWGRCKLNWTYSLCHIMWIKWLFLLIFKLFKGKFKWVQECKPFEIRFYAVSRFGHACCADLPGGWQWGHAVPCPSGVPAACWFSGSAAWCWWPWWTPSAPVSRRSSWPQADRSPRTPRSERRTKALSVDPHKHYSVGKSCKHQGMRSTKPNIKYSQFDIMVKTQCLSIMILYCSYSQPTGGPQSITQRAAEAVVLPSGKIIIIIIVISNDSYFYIYVHVFKNSHK